MHPSDCLLSVQQSPDVAPAALVVHLADMPAVYSSLLNKYLLLHMLLPLIIRILLLLLLHLVHLMILILLLWLLLVLSHLQCHGLKLDVSTKFNE